MPTLHIVPPDLRRLYDVHEWRNAAGVLKTACPKEWNDIIAVLRTFRLYEAEIKKAGGNLSSISKRLAGDFARREWDERKFETAFLVNENRLDSRTHKIDCLKNRAALEIEWNSKDTSFDRDLNVFRLLFELNQIDAGVIITRSGDLDAIFKRLGKNMWSSTTRLKSLLPRLNGGGGGGCPILVFAITPSLLVEGYPPPA